MESIQTQVQKIHSQYGMSEKANYQIQLMFDEELNKQKAETAIGFAEWLSDNNYSKSLIKGTWLKDYKRHSVTELFTIYINQL